MAFIVPDAQRSEFASWEQLRNTPGLRLAIPDIPYYIQKMHERLPRADVQIVEDLKPFFAARGGSGIDALVFAAERGSAWTLMYPEYSVVDPRGRHR